MKVKPTKTVIVLDQPKGGRLANQLWNSISIYAYCLHKNFTFFNPSFVQYADYFPNLQTPQTFRSKVIHSIARHRKLFDVYRQSIITRSAQNVAIASRQTFYLAPSPAGSAQKKKVLARLENTTSKQIYFYGWLFRNPLGIDKYRKNILNQFAPQPESSATVSAFLKPLRNKYKYVIGVHIRQTDYRRYANGKYYLSQVRIHSMLEKYHRSLGGSRQSTGYVLCSDEAINTALFSDKKYHLGIGTEIEDLFTLSKCDAIIGSNSTYGALAAYMGDIPIKVFNDNQKNWDTFRKATSFNYYNECTTVHQ